MSLRKSLRRKPRLSAGPATSAEDQLGRSSTKPVKRTGGSGVGAGGAHGGSRDGARPDLPTGSTAPSVAPLPIASAIGVQIRQIRKRQEITAADLAHRAGLSTGMLSKIETGSVSASLESLEAVARALNVPLTSFFASYEERSDCSHVPAGKGVTIERRGSKAGHQYQLLGHTLSGDVVVEPYLITLTDEAEPYPVFQHAGIEFIYMLSGAVSYRHADKTYELRPGDALMFDSRAPHGPETLSKLPMTYLSVIVHTRE
jgi:transcriptional regulator with XRE-family HTH domain